MRKNEMRLLAFVTEIRGHKLGVHIRREILYQFQLSPSRFCRGGILTPSPPFRTIIPGGMSLYVGKHLIPGTA